LRYHETVGGFFGASQRGADSTSFEGGTKVASRESRDRLLSSTKDVMYGATLEENLALIQTIFGETITRSAVIFLSYVSLAMLPPVYFCLKFF